MAKAMRHSIGRCATIRGGAVYHARSAEGFGRDKARLREMLSILMLLMLAMLLFACPAYADSDHSKMASASQMASAKALLLEGMQPIAADMINDGTYEIQAESTSPFFKIKGAKLTVANGTMTAVLDFDSKSYPLLFMGAAEQAAKAPYEDYIEFDSSTWTFTVPVEALDAEIDCAAWSKRRKQWYDRKLMFYAATLPADALKVELPEYGDPVDSTKAETAKTTQDVASGAVHDDGYEAVAIDLPDGEYSIEVNMTGGSGRASVSSPTWLIVEDGHAYARLLWSSSYYDYMIVDEQRYENLTDDGSNSTFVIPITKMDEEIPVVADTTAMGDPVEIEYHLTFYSNTVDDKDAIPQEAAIKVLFIAIIVIVVGGILNHILKKGKKR